MRPPLKLRNFFEQYFPDCTSYGLETKREGPNGPEGWKVEVSWNELIDHDTCAQTVLDATLEFLEECPGSPYRALARVGKEISPDGRIRCDFALPGGGVMNPYPLDVNAIMGVDADGQNNAQGAALMNFVLGFARADSDKAEAQLEAARERENVLMDSIVDLISETREDRKMFIEETRKDREAHDLRLEPILGVTIDTLKAAAELVKIHNDSSTQVQLAKLEYEAEEKKMEMYVEIGGPVLKGMMKKLADRRKKPQAQAATMPIDVNTEDKEPPRNGPTRELFLIIEKLSDEQIEKATAILPDGMFDRLDNAAHSADDAKTTVALGEIKGAYEKLGKMKGLQQMFKLGEVLGEELGERFIALFDAEAEEQPALEAAAPPAMAEVVQLRKKTGYVAGLAGFKNLTDEDTVIIGQQFGSGLAGVLIGAAEGDDEDAAFAAVCTLSSQLKTLAEETSEDEANQRLDTVLNVIGDEDGSIVDLIVKAVDEVDPST